MRTNLSSQIVLDRIPKRYYNPETEFELSALTRFEKVLTHIYDTSNNVSVRIALQIAQRIKEKQSLNQTFVLGLSGGRALSTIYQELIQKHQKEGLSFRNVIVVCAYEFYPLTDQSSSYLKYLKESFLNNIDIKPENIYSPNGSVSAADILNSCREYEQKINSVGGIDYMLAEVGRMGNIAINIPGSSFSSQTRLILLNDQIRKEGANIFGNSENVPGSAITIGLSTIMKSKEVVLTACGDNKAACVKQMVEMSAQDTVPVSCIQSHQNATLYTDLNAAALLTRLDHPWLVTNCEWNNKLIRRAIVWLCFKVNRPILKLTNKDYQENGLEELLAIYGSAYNVNIKIFNDLQHTITGWPGGKPNADDTNRPERANPYPKRVIIFSPHPDDDVISMGGTYRRLVDQKHDVHVAYQTSGNIAVGDEEVIRYISFMEDIRSGYDPENSKLQKQYSSTLNFLLHDKKDGDQDTKDVLFYKGRIRREEARTAGRYVGINPQNIKFLDLPFYETGKIKKKPLSEADVKIVKQYLNDIKPHQMFVAGDLADPHGTHKVCLDAILAAIDELKSEDAAWLKECRIWMYRGAWAEWDIDHIEMAVPLSPEELRSKRNAILKHQSQMESAPFLGNDERLFWQRSEDRNRATAELYHRLGLASYEAIEAFVEYHPL